MAYWWSTCSDLLIIQGSGLDTMCLHFEIDGIKVAVLEMVIVNAKIQI